MRPPLRASFPIFWQHKFLIFWAATFGIGMFNTLQYASLNYTSATNVGLLQVALPVFIAAVDRVVYKTPISALQISGMVFATIGVFVVLTKGSLAQLHALQFNLGDILMLTAIGVYSIFSVLIKALPKLDQWTFLFVIFVIGALQLLPFLFYEFAYDRQIQVTSETVWVIAYIVIGPAFLAYKFYTSGVSTLGPNKAGMFFYWIPIATAIMATMFLDESLQLFHFAGFCLVGLGLRLGLSEKKQQAEHTS
jgi:drug/metabolite transporter (DMT)-like permease